MDLSTVIKEQRKELVHIEQAEPLVQREIIPLARRLLRYPNVLAILGIRRCGKSLLSYLLVQDKSFGYINFDDERLRGLETEDLNSVLQAFYEMYGDVEYIVLDELQNVAGWELLVNRLRRTKKVIITGSNSKLLSGELATHLTGRYVDVTLFPFSFREFLMRERWEEQQTYTTLEKAVLLNHLQTYLEDGGFPEVKKIGRSLLPLIYDNILTKDILLRHRIAKREELKKVAKYLVTNSAEEFTYSKLARVVGVSHVATISKWVAYLQEAFLLFPLERFHFKLKEQFLAPKKCYCADPGLLSSIAFSFSENRGKVMENAVFVEWLRRKGGSAGLELYYWKDYQQHEVDFVIKRKNKVEQLVQVSSIRHKDEVKEREILSLMKASRELRCKNLLVITWDYEAQQKQQGVVIRYLPLWKWLLER